MKIAIQTDRQTDVHGLYLEQLLAPIKQITIEVYPINSLRPRPNTRHFADDIFKCIFQNENEWISPRISLKFVPKVRINNIPALVQIMAWRRPGDKPLSEPMMVSLLTHICVTRPQWVLYKACAYGHPLDQQWSMKIRPRISNYISNFMWKEITHPYPKFNGRWTKSRWK